MSDGEDTARGSFSPLTGIRALRSAGNKITNWHSGKEFQSPDGDSRAPEDLSECIVSAIKKPFQSPDGDSRAPEIADQSVTGAAQIQVSVP